MTKREIESKIKKLELFKKPQITRLGRGNNSDVFLLVDKGKKYTLRVGRNTHIAEQMFNEQYTTLKFLKDSRIDFAPHPVYFDKKNQILIATYLPGRDIVEKGLTKKQFKIFVKEFIKIQQLSFERYKKICKKENIKIKVPETPVDSIKMYGLKPFRSLARICPDQELINWVKPRLLDNYKYLKKTNWSNKKLMFTHGDLTGENILTYGDKVNIIDWDRARFIYNLDYGLAYSVIHFDFFAMNQKELIRLYAQGRKLKPATVEKQVLKSMKGIKINDIIWAANTWSEMEIEKKRGWKKYKQMAYQRQREYIDYFEKTI